MCVRVCDVCMCMCMCMFVCVSMHVFTCVYVSAYGWYVWVCVGVRMCGCLSA